MCKMRRLIEPLSIGFLLALFVAAFTKAFVSGNAAPGKLRLAPRNPEFVKYMHESERGMHANVTEEGHGLGLMPDPFQLPKVKGIRVLRVLPASFDLRTLNGVTPVKDQGTCGLCWAFATFGSMESKLLYKGRETRDFSEQDMNQYHGFSHGECDAGNRGMSTAYLVRWDGPINEGDLPYPYLGQEKTPGATVQKNVYEVWYLPDRASSTDNDAVKGAVKDNGGVYTATWWDNVFYNSKTYAYYNNVGTTSNPNAGGHGVTVAGWDDNFSKANFVSSTQPPANGAFLIKNSWGTWWGNAGYCWISYYDKSIKGFSQFHSAINPGLYQKMYEYDPLGWTDSCGYGTLSAYMANIYKAGTYPHQNRIRAIGFYIPAPGTRIEFSLYKDLPDINNTTPIGTLVTTKSASYTRAGYKILNFATSTGPYVTAGKKFSVVVKITLPSSTPAASGYPIAIESRIPGYTDAATAGKWQSFLCSDGVSWKDLHLQGGDWGYASVCLKAYAGK